MVNKISEFDKFWAFVEFVVSSHNIMERGDNAENITF